MSRHRVIVRAVAAAVVLAVLAAVSPASAAVEPRDRVYASYLPTVDQVSRIYPEFTGGQRSVGTYLGLGATFDCWDWTSAFVAADGRWSYYTVPDGGMPYFRGMEDPAAFVFKFSTRTKASEAYWQQQRFIRRCMGEQVSDDTTARLWRQPVPFMRQGSVAYRSVLTIPVPGGVRRTRELHVAVLDGRYLVNIYNQARDFQPDTRHGVRLARITVGNIG